MMMIYHPWITMKRDGPRRQDAAVRLDLRLDDCSYIRAERTFAPIHIAPEPAP